MLYKNVLELKGIPGSYTDLFCARNKNIDIKTLIVYSLFHVSSVH